MPRSEPVGAMSRLSAHEASGEDGKPLSEQAVRAVEEGRADHAAGRTFTLAEIEKEPGVAPGGPGRDPE